MSVGELARTSILQLFLGAVLWLSIGIGVSKIGEAAGVILTSERSFEPVEPVLGNRVWPAVIGLALLLVAGWVFNTLYLQSVVGLPDSFLVPLLYLGVTVWAFFYPLKFAAAVPARFLWVNGSLQTPAWGLAAIMGTSILFRALLGDRELGKGVTSSRYMAFMYFLMGIGAAPLAAFALVELSKQVSTLKYGGVLINAAPSAGGQPAWPGLFLFFLILVSVLFTEALRWPTPPWVQVMIGVIYVGFTVWAIVAPATFNSPTIALAAGWGYAFLFAVPLLTIGSTRLLDT